MSEIKRCRGRPVGTGHGILLRDRDFELLRFINDMKFAPVDELFRLFFERTYKKGPAKSDLWAKERLEHLRREGFLKKVRTFYEMQSYYLVTEKGVNTLRGHFLDEEIPNFVEEIDARYYRHDLNILKCRVAFEVSGRARDWECERRIRSRVLSDVVAQYPTYRERELRQGAIEAARFLIPDGIYTNKQGERIAFEFEENIKEPERYAAKLEGFLKMIQRPKADFKRVLFVASKVNVYLILEKLTRPYAELKAFRVNMLDTALKVSVPAATTVMTAAMRDELGDLSLLLLPEDVHG
jgi:hypothetical protein